MELIVLVRDLVDAEAAESNRPGAAGSRHVGQLASVPIGQDDVADRRKARVIFHAVASGSDAAYLDFHPSNGGARDPGTRWVVSANCVRDRRTPCNAPSGIVDPCGTWRRARRSLEIT
jgi:hypothetical protein